MPSILLWRLGALGDSLLLLPALAACRAAFPTHDIVVAGQRAALEPALWSGLADRVVDGDAQGLAPLAAGDPPPHGSLPRDIVLAVVWSAGHEHVAKGLRRYGVPRVIAAPALPPTPIAVASYYLSALAPLGIAPVPFTLRPPRQAVIDTGVAWRVATSGSARPVVALHPGAGSTLKRWPLRRFLALAGLLRRDGVDVVWTAGPADEEVRAALQATGEEQYALPLLDIGGLSAVLSRAAVVVSGDCGVAHLSALLAVPGVTLFGPTDHLAWGPPGRETSVLRLALPCSPCGEVARRCPTRICLRGLPVAAVRAAVHARLDAHPSADTAPHPGPPRPAVWCPPAPTPAPPGALPVARWDRAHRWGAGQPSRPG